MRLLLLNADTIILFHDYYWIECQGSTFLQLRWPMPSRCEHIAMKPARKKRHLTTRLAALSFESPSGWQRSWQPGLRRSSQPLSVSQDILKVH
jgi:hypothetical protein